MVRVAVADGVRFGVVLSGLVVLLALVGTAPARARQPDKILNYQASGLPSMREYLLLNGLINIATGLALGSTGGAVLGSVGALVGKLFFCRVS